MSESTNCPRLDLELDIKVIIPNHEKELKKASMLFSNLRNEFMDIVHPVGVDENNKKVYLVSKLDDVNFIKMYEETVKILDYVGNLSKAIFNIEFDIEEAYTLKYLKFPLEVKQVWYEHYSELHSEYTTIKNRCFNLLRELDEEYVLKFNNQPPNFNI